MENKIELYLGDCLEIMPTLLDVDAIITDIPYGSTACSWDEVIPLDEMWKQVKRITGVFITTASQPFTSKLVMSNREWFKHSWVWDKEIAGSFVLAKHGPMKIHEDICVFGSNRINYFPIMEDARPDRIRPINKDSSLPNTMRLTRVASAPDYQPNKRYPKSILTYSKYMKECNQLNRVHPTQKPVALYEYLIRTYTNKGDIVLDIAMGSGTTGEACISTGRNFIGIEIELKYFKIAEKRIKEAQLQMRFNL